MTIAANETFGVDYLARDYRDVCDDCGELTKCYTYNGSNLCADCVDERDLFVCENCGDVTDCDEKRETPDGDDWCDECYSDAYMSCERCEDAVANDDAVQVNVYNHYGVGRDSQYWCEDCADRYATCCDDCGDYYDNEYCRSTASGADICDRCYYDSYFTCEDCGEVYHNDDMGGCEDGCYCNDCTPCCGDFDPAGFRSRGCCTELGSGRRYGVELETDECDSYYDLDGHAAWGAKDDATVNGKEFFSDVLEGDDGLAAVRDWAGLAAKHGWRAGVNAGFHLHIDLSNDSDDSRFAIAYAYRAAQTVWMSFVAERRRGGYYCDYMRDACGDIERAAADSSYSAFAFRSSRYYWANVSSYSRHRTIEIRAHEGTCDGVAVCNWIKAHTRFADWAGSKGLAGVMDAMNGLDDNEIFELIAREAWQDNELRAYYASRSNRADLVGV